LYRIHKDFTMNNLIKIIFICWSIWHYSYYSKEIKREIKIVQKGLISLIKTLKVPQITKSKQPFEYTPSGTVEVYESEEPKIDTNMMKQAVWYQNINEPIMSQPVRP